MHTAECQFVVVILCADIVCFADQLDGDCCLFGCFGEQGDGFVPITGRYALAELELHNKNVGVFVGGCCDPDGLSYWRFGLLDADRWSLHNCVVSIIQNFLCALRTIISANAEFAVQIPNARIDIDDSVRMFSG